MISMTHCNRTSVYVHGATLSLIALIALGIISEMWLVPLRPGGSSMVLKVLPLFFSLRGVLKFDKNGRAESDTAHAWILEKRRIYTLQWSSMLILLYFTEGIVRATSDKSLLSSQLAWLQVILCVVFFICALGYLGPLKKAAKKMAGASVQIQRK